MSPPTTFEAPESADIVANAIVIFNPFVGVLALVIGFALGLRLLMAVRRMF